MEVTSLNEDHTLEIAKDLAHKLAPGSVVALTGELGAGKTTFTRGLVASLGSNDRVQSPTFTLLREYQTQNGILIQHFDLYRITSVEDLRSISFSELIDNTEAISIIEWPELVKELLPEKTIYIDLKAINDQERVITIEGL